MELLARPDEWRLDLRHVAPEWVDRIAAAAASGTSWREYAGVAPAESAALAARLVPLLFHGTGVAVLSADPGLSDDALRLLFLALGRGFGRNVSPTVGGETRPLFAVTASADPTIGGRYAGNGRNANILGLHTDGSGIHLGRVDLLGMLCLQPAASGGVSRVADAGTVYARLPERVKAELAVPVARTDPYAPKLSAAELVIRPVAEIGAGGRIRFSYHSDRVRGGVALQRGAVPPGLAAALDTLDRGLESAAEDVLLQRGDMILIDNWVVAHGRTAFTDAPGRPRLIERLWIERDPDPRGP